MAARSARPVGPQTLVGTDRLRTAEPPGTAASPLAAPGGPLPHSELPPPFACEVRPDRERAVLRLSGELDLAVVPELRDAVQQLLQVGFEVLVVDLRGLTFIDSSGLRELLSASRAATAAGSRLCLVRGPEAVHRVFEITSATELFDFDGLARRD